MQSNAHKLSLECSHFLSKKWNLLRIRKVIVFLISDFPGVANVIEFCPVYYLKNLDCYYQGQWLNCLPHGCGIAVYRNQSYYEGDFEKGEIETEEGLYYFNNGEDKNF